MRALVLLLAVGSAATAFAQTAPPPPLVAPPEGDTPPPPLVAPPSYPPAPPQVPPAEPPPPSLAPTPPPPYQPLAAQAPAATPPSEFGLASAEFFASAAVTIGATVAVNAAIHATDTPSQQATAQIAALLYMALIPSASSLPVWLIGLASDHYDPRIGPAIEAGSAVSGIAVLIYLVADQVEQQSGTTSPWKYAAGGILVIGMPLAEVIALNLGKTPHLGAPAPPPYLGALRADLPERQADLGAPIPGTVVFALPGVSF